VDYVEDAGTVSLDAGQLNTSIDISIIDNDKPELNKTFQVKLYNAKQGGKVILNYIERQVMGREFVGIVVVVYDFHLCDQGSIPAI
jgi:hypothetical protein